MRTAVYERIKKTCPEDLPQAVLKAIHGATAEKRMAKVDIAARLGLDYNQTIDRQIRDAVADLREAGYPVLSESGKPGYWLASSPSEIDEYERETLSRVYCLLKSLNGVRRFRAQQPQMRMGI